VGRNNEQARIIRCLRPIVAGMQFSVSHGVSLLTVSDSGPVV